MANLMDEIDNRLKEYNLGPISDVVNNKRKSIRYINEILKENGNKVTIPFQLTLDKYDFRVKHVLFSFGLGVVLASFLGLKEEIERVYQKYGSKTSFIYIWLTLCLYHDFGYFVGSSYLKTDDIGQLLLDHKIFEYDYCKSRYSKQLYVEYYKDKYLSQKWDEKNYDMSRNEEVGDHGILGGYVLFDRLYSSEVKPEVPKSGLAKAVYERLNRYDNTDYHFERVPLYQDICYRIMEHNIWKTNKKAEKDDPLVEIDIDHFNRISTNEPLLYLLSLVDTIEMTKRFCTYIDDSEDKERYVYPKTLGSKIQIEVSDGKMEIDYHELEKYIEEHKYFDSINRWRTSVIGLKDWVEIAVSKSDASNILLMKE